MMAFPLLILRRCYLETVLLHLLRRIIQALTGHRLFEFKRKRRPSPINKLQKCPLLLIDKDPILIFNLPYGFLLVHQLGNQVLVIYMTWNSFSLIVNKLLPISEPFNVYQIFQRVGLSRVFF